MNDTNGVGTTNNKKIKLLHYLQIHGYATSNKHAKKLIRNQKVIVNGTLASSCSIMVMHYKSGDDDDQVVILNDNNNNDNKDGDEDDDNYVKINGKGSSCHSLLSSSLSLPLPSSKPICIVYNKPCGMICTASTTTCNKLPKNNNEPSCHLPLLTLSNANIPKNNGYHPVGRLDKHSHGLLLFSLDGRLTSAFLSPRSCIPRIYDIIVCGDVGLSSSKDEKEGGGGGGLDDENVNDNNNYLYTKYKDIITKVENGVHTDYGFFKGNILDMKRDVGVKTNKDNNGNGDNNNNNIEYSYVHEKCHDNSYSNAKRNDKYGMSPEEFAKLDYVNNSNTTGTSDNNILSFIRVRVNEGKKRMVRRLFASLDLFVVGKY